MATKKRLDQLPAILSGDVGNNDLMYLVNENALAETGYDSKKILVAEVAKKLLGGVELPTALPDFPEGEQNALSALEYLNEKINDLYPVVTESGSLATFTTPLALPLVSLKANITATQSGTGVPSPQNVRSISGFSSVRLWQVSNYAEYFKGLLSGTYGFVDLGDCSWGYNNGFFRLQNLSNYKKPASQNIATNAISEQYQAKSWNEINSSDNGCFAFSSGSDYPIFVNTAYTNATAFKTAMSGVYLIYELATPTTPTITNAQFETLCQAFGISSNAITISLGDTYYGGVLDVKNGTASKTFDIADFSNLVKNSASPTNWVYYSNQSNFDNNKRDEVLCSHFSKGGLSTPATWINSNKIIYFNLDGVIDTNDVETAKAYLANVQFVYPLATPTEITGLTPDNFTTIAGQNNIFADSGDVELSFKQGIQEYIDEQIATTQALIL